MEYLTKADIEYQNKPACVYVNLLCVCDESLNRKTMEIPGTVCVCNLSIYIYIYIHTYRCVHKGKHNKTHGQSKGKEHKLVCNGIDITWAVNIIKCGDQQFLTWQIQTG